MKPFVFLLLVAALSTTSCFRQIGSNLVAGAGEEVGTLGENLVGGVGDGLANDTLQAELQALIGGVLSTIDDSLNPVLANLQIDTVIERVVNTLIAELQNDELTKALDSLLSSTGASVEDLVNSLIASVTSAENQAQINAFVSGIIEENLNQKLKASLTGILDSVLTKQGALDLTSNLLNDSLTIGLQTVVDSLLMTVSRRLPEITGEAEQSIGFIKKEAEKLLALLAALAAGIILLIWRQRRKYLKLAKMLANQIHEIPDQDTFNELTHRISREARRNDTEKHLRSLLAEDGILGEEAWRNKKAKQTAISD